MRPLQDQYFVLRKGLKNVLLLLLLLLPVSVKCDNTTNAVFGTDTVGYPVAFGDFDSDERTDLFILDKEKTSVEVLFAREQEPLFKADGVKCSMPFKISSVVPGKFDGDSHLDVLITTTSGGKTKTYILWGDGGRLNCSLTSAPIITVDQPLALDYNSDMIIDLFGTLENGTSVFWVFNQNRTSPSVIILEQNRTEMRAPHSHAFIDFNDDFAADLVLSTKSGYDIWFSEYGDFKHNRSIKNPPGKIIGQSVFVDIELEGSMTHLVPVCIDEKCKNSTIFAFYQNKWVPLNPILKDKSGSLWGFLHDTDSFYSSSITLRAGDFNMDGYPDLLASLTLNGNTQVFLLENIPCSSQNECGGISRTFSISKGALTPLNQGTVAGTFYDLYQDGVLDVILVGKNGEMSAFRNTLDYDANFVKVMVLSGERSGSLPGPRVSYRTTTQEGNLREAIVAQLPQSAHLPLGLPYSIFGLGRTPNFVDRLTVGNAGKSHDWTQIIPNSQMVVIIPAEGRWRAQLFVTPSKLILLSVAALTGTCFLIVGIIGILYLRERKEDRLEKLQEAHRFHFDAM